MECCAHPTTASALSTQQKVSKRVCRSHCQPQKTNPPTYLSNTRVDDSNVSCVDFSFSHRSICCKLSACSAMASSARVPSVTELATAHSIQHIASAARTPASRYCTSERRGGRVHGCMGVCMCVCACGVSLWCVLVCAESAASAESPGRATVDSRQSTVNVHVPCIPLDILKLAAWMPRPAALASLSVLLPAALPSLSS